jgi:hypothetical protein
MMTHRGNIGVTVLLRSEVGGGGLTPRPGLFTAGNVPVLNVQEVRWAPRPVSTGAVIVAATGIRSSDRPASSCTVYAVPVSCIFT